MRKTTASALTLCVLAAFVLAACSKLATSAGGPGGHAWTRPGVLRIADISDPSTLNPMLSGADIAYQLGAFTLEFLVQLDDRGQIVPVLCAEVPSAQNGGISKDGRTITYHLRRNVAWSDGRPFGAADVIASWKQVINPLNNVQIREGYDVIQRIEAPDRFTAVLHLKQPYAPLITRFFSGIQEGPIAVMPAHIIAGQKELNDSPFNAHPIGTGPFVVQSWERSGKLVLVANPHYWRGRPRLQRIEFQAQPSTSTELVGFKTHEIDANFDAGANRLLEYAMLSGMRAVRSNSLRLYVLDINCGKPPLNDVRLRRAIAYAVDRRAIMHNVQHDAAVLADEWLPRWSWAYTKDVPHYGYDAAKAAALLDEAGWRRGPGGVRWKHGKRLALNIVGVTGSGASKQTSEIVQSYLRSAGIEAQIKNYPYGIVFNVDGPVRQGKFDLVNYSFSVNFDPAAYNYDGCDQFAPKGANEARICDRAVDREERLALRLTDQTERKALYADIERRRMEDVGGLPMYFLERVGVLNVDLQGYSPSRGIVPEWNAWQWSI